MQKVFPCPMMRAGAIAEFALINSQYKYVKVYMINAVSDLRGLNLILLSKFTSRKFNLFHNICFILILPITSVSSLIFNMTFDIILDLLNYNHSTQMTNIPSPSIGFL